MQDLNHISNTAFEPDNYTREHIHKEWSPFGWQHEIAGHACHDPNKVTESVIVLFCPVLVVCASVVCSDDSRRVQGRHINTLRRLQVHRASII